MTNQHNPQRKSEFADMNISFAEITSDMAALMLESNTRNRAINIKRVQEIARYMSNGTFIANGDAIRIAKDGVLLDGQHRLSACVMSGRPFKTILVTGLDPQVMPTIDQHAKRTVGNVLAIEGYPNSIRLAAAARGIFAIAEGSFRWARLNAQDVVRVVRIHPGLERSTTKALKCFPGIGSELIAIHYIASFLGKEEQADSFIEVWKTGVPSYDGDAAHAARERIARSNASSAKVLPNDRFKLVVGSWNLFEKGTAVSKAVIPAKPAIRGWGLEELWGEKTMFSCNEIGPATEAAE